MRSISLKLALAFLGTSLISILAIALLARWTTGQEFDRYAFGQNKDDLAAALEEYYSTYGGWQGIDEAPLFMPVGSPAGHGNGESIPMAIPITIVDEYGRVIRGRPPYMFGDTIPTSELESGIPIEVDGEVVGILLVGRDAFRENPLAKDFFQRTGELLLFSALGVTAIALVLGLILSRTITRPIRELTKATQAVSEGNLSQQVPVRSRDELGELARSFNKMSTDLARSVNTRRQMTADIAHELRTPLSIILGHADAVCDGVLPPSVETVGIIRDEASRLEHLINDLRILSLADAGELSLDLQPVNPQELLYEIRQRYMVQANLKHIELQVDATPNLPAVEIDPGRITQVLTNILENALRHTPEGGKVILTAQKVQDMIQISIQDSGPGVSEDELGNIFRRFYRTDPSRQRVEDGGSGLGLAIAKSIIERHGGTIRAKSKPGQGLKVIITLPIN
jgi:two-component system sensor histidine kinase BaeS